MRGLIIIIALTASACSYTPVADLRASGESAQLYQRDLNECRQLVKQARSIWNAPWGGRDTWLTDCLAGRGHSIIGG